jgi:hypothetical protein
MNPRIELIRRYYNFLSTPIDYLWYGGEDLLSVSVYKYVGKNINTKVPTALRIESGVQPVTVLESTTFTNSDVVSVVIPETVEKIF